MKFSITPIGTDPGDGGSSAKKIVDYLFGKKAAAKGERPLMGDDPSKVVTYYGDAIEGPGHWWGSGAAVLGLEGQVDEDDLSVLLQGRHHRTGERLLAASGSAGRRRLRVGEPSRWIEGKPVWGRLDAAAKFDLDLETFDDIVRTLGLGATIDSEGEGWVHLDQMRAVALKLDLSVEPPRAPANDIPGNGDDILTTAEAAELLGVTPRYVRMACKNYELNGDNPIGNGWIKAERNTTGNYEISVDSLREYVQRRKPPSVRVAYDATATLDKSVSVLTLMAPDPAVRDRCNQAMDIANRHGLAWLQRWASSGRSKQAEAHSEGLAIASFVHGTSRNHDPHPHIHNLILNAASDRYGVGRALDARRLFTQSQTASAIATAAERWHLTTTLGVGWEQDSNGIWQIAGIPPAVLNALSSRKAEIEAAVGELMEQVHANRNEIQEASKKTRQPKKQITAAELTGRWWNTVAEFGFTPADLQQTLGRAKAPAAQLTNSEQHELDEFLVGDSGACSHGSSFNFGQLMVAINQWAPDGQLRIMPPEETQRQAHRFLSSRLAIPVAADAELIVRRDGKKVGMGLADPHWTTPQTIALQTAAAARWIQGIQEQRTPATLDPDHVTEALDASDLSDEQQHLVRTWTTSGDTYQGAVGRPGTGKTHTMKTANELWTAAGCHVLGAAVKGTAAQNLARETSIPTETVASWVGRLERGEQPFDAKTVLIIDEASTLTDRDLGYLMHAIDDAGGILRTLGDPAQQSAVGPGGLWAEIALGERTPELTQQRRLQNRDEQNAADIIRHGDIAGAFASMSDTGQLTETPPNKIELEAIRRWFHRHDTGQDLAPIIATSNVTRHKLNAIAQHIRISRGEVTEPITLNELIIGIGDHLISRAPDRENRTARGYLANGMRGTVTGIGDTTITVDFPDIGTLHLDQRWASTNTSLAYSVTSYGVQGETYDHAESVIRPGDHVSSVYVALTHGRKTNHANAAPKEPSPELHLIHDDPNPDVATQIRQSDIAPVTIADRGIIEAAARDHLDHRNNPTARSQRHATLRAHHANTVQDTSGKDRYLPAAPITPWLAHLHHKASRAVAHYQTIHQPLPGNGPYDRCIGTRPADHDPAQPSWDRTSRALTEAAIEIRLRDLHNHTHKPEFFETVNDTDHSPVQQIIAAIAATQTELGELSAKYADAIADTPTDKIRIRHRQATHNRHLHHIETQLETNQHHLHQLYNQLASTGTPTTPQTATTLIHQALTERPEWVLTLLEQAAGNGHLATTPTVTLTNLISDIALHRHRWGITTTDPLGEKPANHGQHLHDHNQLRQLIHQPAPSTARTALAR